MDYKRNVFAASISSGIRGEIWLAFIYVSRGASVKRMKVARKSVRELLLASWEFHGPLAAVSFWGRNRLPYRKI